MTNTRRKTFPDPLSFWQWAIEDSMRQAQNSIGHRFMVQVSPSTGAVIPWRAIGLQGGAFGPTDSDCPLTAVEDEHGVIEEEKPMMPAEAALRAFYGGDKAPHLVDKIVALIDERIAAATVETHCLPTRDALFSIPGTEPAWIPRNNLRLKPKGESK